MKDSSLSRRKRTKLKLLVSFNGSFRRRPLSRKLRYVGGETRIISVERNTSFQILKSKIADLICPNANFSQFCLKYHVSESFCGDDGEEEGPVLGLLESDDDLRCMIEEYETMELKGKLHTRVWIFVCYTNDGFNDSAFVDKHVINVNGDRFYGKNNGFVKALGEGLDGDDKNQSENMSVLFNKYESKTKKLRDDSLRKMVLKQQLLVKNLDGIRSVRGCREQIDTELASENDICQSSPKQLCSELGSPLSSECQNINSGGDPYTENVLNCKRTNGHIVTNESSGKISPVAESNSGPLNSKDGNLPMRCKGSNGSLLGQSHMIFGNRNGHYMLSPNQYFAAEKPPKLSLDSSMNWLVNGLDLNCEFGSVDLALLNNMNRENIMPQSDDFNMVKRGLAPLTCCNPLISGVYPVESLQNSESQLRGYGGSVPNHRFGLSEARNQRACPYYNRNRCNVSELGNHQNFRLDRKSWIGKFYPGLRSSSNISKQGPPSRSQGATPRKPLSGSHYCEIQGERGIIEHGHMLNPPYCGEENLPKPVGCRVPQHETANVDDGQVAHAGNGKSLLPIDSNGNSLLAAKAVDVHIDLSTSSGIEKIDVAGQAVGENSLDVVGMVGQTPSNYVEEPHSKNKGEDFNLSNNGASVVDLSLHNLSLDSCGKVQLPVPCARKDISEAFPKPQSNGLDLMDEEHINSGPKFEIASDISSDSSSSNVSKFDNDDDKREAIQQNPKSNSSIAEKDEDKKTSSCLKGNDGIPADIAALYSYLATRELQIIKNADLEYAKELGQGTYGTVYYGKWKGSDVAIKRIKPSCFIDGVKEEDRLVADFWKEAHTLGQLHHPNIVALYGVVIDGPVNCLATVTEYMVNGSLKQVLRRKDRTIDRRKRLIIAMDAAFGMEYLHGKNIVHFDLKSHNFLVNMRDPHRPVCKIGDLGLSKIKQRTLVSGGIRGTIPWMAPELLSGRDLVSEKVDVFSFGIVMWELLTGEEPYANMRSEEIIAGIIRGNLRPEIPSWCDPLWRSLMERCWSSNPDCRPSFSQIAKELRAMAASMNIK